MASCCTRYARTIKPSPHIEPLDTLLLDSNEIHCRLHVLRDERRMKRLLRTVIFQDEQPQHLETPPARDQEHAALEARNTGELAVRLVGQILCCVHLYVGKVPTMGFRGLLFPGARVEYVVDLLSPSIHALLVEDECESSVHSLALSDELHLRLRGGGAGIGLRIRELRGG